MNVLLYIIARADIDKLAYISPRLLEKQIKAVRGAYIFLVWMESESQWASWWVLVELLLLLLVLFLWGAERDLMKNTVYFACFS